MIVKYTVILLVLRFVDCVFFNVLSVFSNRTFHYLCIVKRILTYLLLIITFVGMISTLNVESHKSLCVHQSQNNSQHETVFSNISIFVSSGITNGQIQLHTLFQQAPLRQNLSSTNQLRIKHSTQIAQLRFFCRNDLFAFKQSNKQLSGYYFYQLCKLLI